MKYTLIVTLFVAVACDTCKNLDCTVPPFDYFQFTYVNEDEEDLLAGTTQKYEPADIKVFSLDENENRVEAGLSYVEGDPTVVNVQLMRSIERTFLEVKGDVTDTLDFKFKYHKTDCCGTTSKISKTTLNGELYSGILPIQIKERE